MLMYKLKKIYKDFLELESDILKLYPNAKVWDDYFKVYVEFDDNFEKLNIQHHSGKIEVLK